MADREWPSPLGDAAYHGIVGSYVRAVEPHTEADPAAVLIQSLACLGNAMGRGPHFFVEDTRHGTNLFVAVVGDTSASRKGTSLDRAFRLATSADPMWGQRNDGEGGLSTPEGLIHAVRDASPSRGNDAPDPGVDDKRFLAAMGEFAETLAKMKRVENPLSATLRSAWDGKKLRNRTRGRPLEATDAHVSVIGHITQADLSDLLSSADIFNGFGNRFLWVMARRSKSLPFGGDLRAAALKKLTAEAAKSVFWALEQPRLIDFDQKARRSWPALYEELGQAAEGRFGAITDRAEAQVRRIALVYAALDRSPSVELAHLRAALEVWRYCEESAAYLFAGDAAASGLERRLLAYLKRETGWVSRNTIAQKHFKGEVPSYKLDSVLRGLRDREVIAERKVPTRGRPRSEYRLVEQ